MGAVRRSGRERAPDPARACQPAQNGSDGADEPAEDILAHSCGPPSTAKASGLLVLVPAQGTGVGGRLLALTRGPGQGPGADRDPPVHERRDDGKPGLVPAAYPRHGYTETHRGEGDGFSRVYFTKQLPGG